MRNTFLPDSDLVYVRADGRSNDDLPELDPADLEPIEDLDLVGVEPFLAVAFFPFEPIEETGRNPFQTRADADYIEDVIPTEEYSSWESELTAAASL